MSADPCRRQDVLTDSEATLRQVQEVLAGLCSPGPIPPDRLDRAVRDLERCPEDLRDLVRVLMTTYREIMDLVDSLRHSRRLIEQATMERLRATDRKTAEVSSATEMAATRMLDGLDRALVLLDHLESRAQLASGPDDTALRSELRDELRALIDLLQFQDITAQQLGYAGGVLMDIEERMVDLAHRNFHTE